MRVFRIAISALILGTVGADAASRPSVIDLGLLSSRGIGKPSSSASQSKAGATEMRLSAVGGKSDFPFVAAYTAMSNVGPDKGLTRSALDAQIFKMAAPAVVLVVTKDGLGSGSLISRDGTILTNYHVVRGFDTVAVLFKPAIEGADPRPEDAIAATVTKINEKIGRAHV